MKKYLKYGIITAQNKTKSKISMFWRTLKHNTSATHHRLRCYVIIGIIIGLCNGLFGSGGGTVAVPCMEKFLDVEKKKAHATAIAIILPLTLISIFFYTEKGFFDFNLVWKVSIGGVLGGVLGAYILKKLKPQYIARIFGIFLIIAAIRMVFR